MPSKGKSRLTDEQRRKIAEGRVNGKTSRVVAAEIGVAHNTVRKQVVDPRTQTLIQELKARHQPQLRRAFGKALDRTEKLITDADPVVALRACKLTNEMVSAGDPPLAKLELNTGDGEREITLEELLVVYRRVTG